MYPVGPKFAQNRSISYSFRDKKHFPFLPKFKMAAEIWKSLNFSKVLEEYSLIPCGSKICPKLLYLLIFQINNIFHFHSIVVTSDLVKAELSK